MKIKALKEILEDDAAAIITSGINRFYLTGFHSSAGSIVITKNSAALLMDFRYFEKASKTVSNMEVLFCQNLFKDIKEILNSHNIKKLYIETENTTVGAFERIKKGLNGFSVSPDSKISDKLSYLRQIKAPEEIRLIKEAQKITDNAFSHILNFIKEGITEKEIALELEFFMRRCGSEGVAFDTIAVSGKNSSLPHGVPTDKPLQNGDFLTMDFGAVFGGYCSDMTRTVALGHVTDEQNRVYDTVLNSQLSALKAVAPLKACNEIDKVARDIISKSGYGEYFGHGLGHSVGLEIHESPACNTRDTTTLKLGMTMTVEPGIYLPDKFGVRIEDMVVVTDNGAENLTHSPKELIIL